MKRLIVAVLLFTMAFGGVAQAADRPDEGVWSGGQPKVPTVCRAMPAIFYKEGFQAGKEVPGFFYTDLKIRCGVPGERLHRVQGETYIKQELPGVGVRLIEGAEEDFDTGLGNIWRYEWVLRKKDRAVARCFDGMKVGMSFWVKVTIAPSGAWAMIPASYGMNPPKDNRGPQSIGVKPFKVNKCTQIPDGKRIGHG